MKSKKAVLYSAVTKILEPLVRILMHFGISASELNELCKRIYVNQTYERFGLPGRKVSTSRVSVLTGLSRKEVVRLTKIIQSESIEDFFHNPINRASRVICGWLQDKEFIDKHNNPLVIPITGKGLSFDSLTQRYSGNITYGAVLDECLRIGAVERVDDNKLKLVSQGYIPKESEMDMIKVIGKSTSDLLSTMEYNLQESDNRRFQREVIYTELSPLAIGEFKLVSREKCNTLLLDLNDWLGEKYRLEKELGRLSPGTKVGVGIYYFEDTDEEISTDDKNN